MAHRVFSGYIRFGLPECHGVCAGRQFAIHQLLVWEELEERLRATFRLMGEAADVGMDCRGGMEVAGEDELAWDMTVQNLQRADTEKAYHTVCLDLEAAPGFIDDYGERTFLYTEAGWCPVRHLLDPSAPAGSAASFRVGAAYRERTVMWKVIARLDVNERTILAFALDRACAFAVNHPNWSTGLLASCRWGQLQAGESRSAAGRIYLIEGGLDVLRERYIRDFKGGRSLGT